MSTQKAAKSANGLQVEVSSAQSSEHLRSRTPVGPASRRESSQAGSPVFNRKKLHIGAQRGKTR